MLNRFWGDGGMAPAARALYDSVVAQARSAGFFEGLGVADTIDGRFDLLTLHAFLIMEALEKRGTEGRELGSALATLIFAGFEDALREFGVSDMGLSKRMKAIASAFYGRLEAYRKSAPSEKDMVSTLERNLYRGEPNRRAEALAIADYVAAVRASLSVPGARADLLLGAVDFGPIPGV